MLQLVATAAFLSWYGKVTVSQCQTDSYNGCARPRLQIRRWEVAAEWTQQKYSRRTLILSPGLCSCLPEEPTAGPISTEIIVSERRSCRRGAWCITETAETRCDTRLNPLMQPASLFLRLPLTPHAGKHEE